MSVRSAESTGWGRFSCASIHAPAGRLTLLAGVAILSAFLVVPRATADEAPGAPAGNHAAREAPTAAPEQIAQWIAELDDNRYLVREQATRHLLAAGAPALDSLLVTANGDRPEPADRAIWLLQKLGRSDDLAVARAALTRTIQLRGRPHLVLAARKELGRVSFLTCKRTLEPLGANVIMIAEQVPSSSIVANFVQVELGEKWQGKTNDLAVLVEDSFHPYLKLTGPGVDDAVVKLLESKHDILLLKLIDTKVTTAAIDSIKACLPATEVYIRGPALLGVAARNRGAGLAVEMVQRGSGAAAAGIREGDILVALDGHPLPDFDRMTAYIAQHRPGDKIQIDVQRGEEKLRLEATLGSWAGQAQ